MSQAGNEREELIPLDRKHNLTPKKRAMIDSLEKTLGIVTTAAKAVGISRWTHYEWMKTDPDYAEQVKELEDLSLDFAESQLLNNIKKGAEASTIFYLKTKGKRRGYVERTEVDALAINMQLGVAEVPQTLSPEDWAETAEKYQSRLREIQRRND